MSEKVIQALARIKGVDAKLLREIMEIQEERQKAMAEVSAIIGVDVTFSRRVLNPESSAICHCVEW